MCTHVTTLTTTKQVLQIQYQAKVWTHLLIQCFFLYYFLHCRLILSQNYAIIHREQVLDFRFFKVDTFCFGDRFADSRVEINRSALLRSTEILLLTGDLFVSTLLDNYLIQHPSCGALGCVYLFDCLSASFMD